MFQSQIQLVRSSDEVMVRADCCDTDTWEDHTTKGLTFERIYRSMRQTLMVGLECSVAWNQSFAKGSESFVGYFQVFSGETATTLKSTSLFAYLGYVLLKNC